MLEANPKETTPSARWWLLAVLVVTLAAGTLLAWEMAKQTDREMREDLLAQTRLVAEAISLDHVRELSGTEADLTLPVYLEFKSLFAALQTFDERIRFVYLIGRKTSGEVFFLVDNEPAGSDDESPPGQIFSEAPEELQRVFETREAVVVGPVTDRWGTWVSGFTPLVDSKAATSGLATPADAQAIVRQALAYYRAKGREGLLRAANDPKGPFRRNELYVYVTDRRMNLLAHPIRPELVGRNMLGEKDWAGGSYFWKEIRALADTSGSGWVQYRWEDPISKRLDAKTAWIEAECDLIVCAGAYETGKGAVAAVLGVDIAVGAWRTAQLGAALPALFLTLALLVVALIAAGPARRCPRPGLAEAACALAVGLVLTLFITWTAHQGEQRSQQQTFAQLGASRTAAVAEAMHNLRHFQLEGLASFYENWPSVDAGEFTHFAAHLEQNRAVQAWEWIPAVPAADRERFEAAARARGLADFDIWQKDTDGTREPAAGREVYYPVLRIAPMKGNEPALGYDLGSEPLRRAALEEAMRTRRAAATEPITLAQSSRGMLVYRPVFETGGDGRLRGFTLAVLDFDQLLGAAARGTGTLTEMHLLRDGGTIEPLASELGMHEHGSPLSLTRPLFFFGKTFALTAHPDESFLRHHPARAGFVALLVGFFISAALALVVALTVRRRVELERLVEDRTTELRASEEHLSATLRSIGDGVIACDAAGAVVSLNPVAEALTGWTSAEAVGKPVGEVFCIINTRTRETAKNPVFRAIREGVSVDLANHTTLISKDGTERQIADSCAPIRDRAGAVGGAVLVFRDVTEEYRRREELRENERQLAMFFSQSLHGFFMCMLDEPIDWNAKGADKEKLLEYALDHQRMTKVNQAMLDQYGATEKDFVGITVRELFKHDIDHAREIWRGLFDRGQWHTETREQKLDGTSVVIDGDYICLYDEQGRITGHFGVQVDITERKRTEDALRKSEERYRLITENVADTIAIQDMDLHWTYVSPSIMRLRGVTPEEATAESLENVMAPKSMRLIAEVFMEELALEKAGTADPARMRTLELQEYHKNGSLIWVETTLSFLRDEDQKPVGILSVTRDITERKQAEDALRESELFLRETQANARLGSWKTNPLTDSLAWSDGVYDIVEERRDYRPGLAEGVKYYHAEYLPALRSGLENCLTTGESFTLEAEITTAKGNLRWVEVRAFACVESGGEPMVMGTIQDITERRQAEAALRDGEARLRSITDTARDAIIMIDDQGTVSFWNPAAETILGYSCAEALGRNLHQLVAPERFHEAHLQAFSQFVRTGCGAAIGKTVELAARRRDGAEISVALSLSAVSHDGKWHAVGILRDITEQKQAQRGLESAMARANEMALQAEMANTAKSEFLANMSHEIRTPMNGVIGMADLLRTTSLDDDQRGMLETITRSADHLLTVIDDILDLSKMEAGQLRLDLRPFDLKTLIEEVVEIVRPRADDAGIAIAMRYEPDTPETFLGDVVRIRQVLLNLAGNAVKFTSEGGIEISVRVQERSGDQTTMRLSVADTGIGIPADKIATIFDKFTQVDGSSTRNTGGAGLGLAISRQLVELMSGAISVTSRPGSGSTFQVDLPLQLARITAPAAPAQSSRAADSLGPDLSVLVVEDNVVNQKVAQRILESLGCRVAVAADGRQAVAMVKNDPFDVVFMDCQMPHMDGFEATAAIRRLQGEPAAVPIVAMTANAMKGDRERCLAAGMDDYVSKPIRRDTLAAVLQRWAGSSASERECDRPVIQPVS